MPNKPKKPCAYPGCPKLTDRKYCAAHAAYETVEERRYERYGRAPETAKRYGSNWRKVRAAYIAGHPLCEDCLVAGRTTPAEQVHHIRPLDKGGDNSFANLRALCKSCHSRYTMTETNEERKR